jgi:hypothetical protein
MTNNLAAELTQFIFLAQDHQGSSGKLDGFGLSLLRFLNLELL